MPDTVTKLRTLKACIFPVATYGCESWTITKCDVKKINAFEMKCYRKILRIPWCDRVTNEEVLERVNIQNCQLMNNIRKLKLTYFGHVKRHNTLEKLCMEEMVENKRGRGRPKRRCSEDVAEWLKTPAARAGATAQDRRLFRSLVWNHRTISLINHPSKKMLKIIMKRLENILETEASNTQAGFRKGRGTRDHIFNLRNIIEKFREIDEDLHICFIDYSKAFDCVIHKHLWKTLRDMGIHNNIVKLIENLYAEQQ
ncbi:transposon TX1 uncharacterized 149 kDa protein [Elysia marginata]|uniref:Transposon TX1 uncharacterized 149 kDa protein n=1 Tax=Elysia marginata TaxID=1093978 RepID=A0AAV4ETE5_9GAST|nr:transposon TX1 uncharacterized 149 kDa protein [Elysia marginata]